MKKALLFMTAAALAGCSQGGGGGSPQACSSTQFATPFAQGKVQVNSIYTTQVDSKMSMADILSVPKVANPTTIPAGTQLVATMKDECIGDGHITPSGVRSVPYKAPKAMTLDELRQLAEENPCVVGLSDHVPMYASAAFTDPDVPQQAHLTAIEQPAGNDTFMAPGALIRDVVVAIIDTGVDINHEDLKDNVWTNTKEIPGNGIDDDHNGYIDDVNGWNFADDTNNVQPECSDCTHGTHVAGLTAARGGNGVGGAGVMGQHVKIMALNVFGNSSGASNSDIDNAIRYAADNGADVINMSLGGSGADSATESAIQYALSKNVTVVVAAGNSGEMIDTKNNFENPASYAGLYHGVLATASVDAQNINNISSWSNYGTSVVKIAAPGADSSSTGLLSTLPGNQYGRMQGTSMASPVAAGVAALAVGYLKSHGVNPTPAAVEAAIVGSAQISSKLTGVVKDGKVVDVKNLAAFVGANLGNLTCN
jgi:subtilisin family serine protease